MRNFSNRSRRRSRRGVALLYAVLASFTAAGMVTMLFTLSRSSDRVANVKRHSTEAQFLAEGAIEGAKKELQTAIANWRAVPTTGSISVDGQTATYTITPTGFESTVTDEAGIQTLVTGYELRAVAAIQGHQAVARRFVNAEATPLFQFAVFYTDDLEVLPGPNMTLTGRVHSNRNMYLGSNSTLTLNTNYVRSVGDIYRSRKDDPSESQGTVRVRQWVQNPWDAAEPASYVNMNSRSQMASLGITTTSGYDSRFTTGHDTDGNGSLYDSGDWLPWGPGALELWGPPAGYSNGTGHTVLSADQGVTESVTPNVGSIAMFESNATGDHVWDGTTNAYVPCAPGTGTHSKGYYHAQAGLTILTKADGTWTATNAAGVDVTSAVASAVTVRDNAMYDARQAGGSNTRVRVTEIDVGLLGATGMFPANGLIYAAHYDEGQGTSAKGVRLKNGSTLPGKLTVASEGPVYIQGDYNTVNKKGAAVIGDAVNLLSNAWNDTKTRGTLPGATNTTYNVAMISGNQSSGVGSYNGGLENLPRFHENWAGRTCTIRGSFVNTWQSQFATGAWVYGGDRYTAPTRNWAYETAFNSVANLPPFTPVAVMARDVVSW